ncbi:plasmid mobilization relaxosome protein MobC [Clostridioides difficile]|nr:plasmid mobilization relaxosome protein MobC [Clostridioides difficile]
MNRTRPKQIVIRVSEEELEAIKKKVEQSGKSQQQYIIEALTQKQVVNLDGLKEIYPELKRQGNNLNQTARALNEIDGALKDSGFYNYRKISEVLTEAKQNQEELKDIWQLLKQYLQKQG